MRKLKVIILLVLLAGCSSKNCSFFQENKDSFEDLLRIIENNPEEFFDDRDIPRSYFIYNYRMSEKDFLKTESANNIDSREFNSLKQLFHNLSIEEFYIYSDGSLIFNVGNKDNFVNEYGYHIVYLKNRLIDDMKDDFEIRRSSNCDGIWYTMVERSSIAN